MEQMEDGLKKVVKAGFGAVATGVEKTQETIARLAKKGEPIYEQARATVEETAGKIKKAVQNCPISDMLSCRPRVDAVIRDLKEMSREERACIRDALDAMDRDEIKKDDCTCRQETDGCQCDSE